MKELLCCPKVIADHRESYFVILALRKMKTEVIKKTMSPGDYVVGKNYWHFI